MEGLPEIGLQRARRIASLHLLDREKARESLLDLVALALGVQRDDQTGQGFQVTTGVVQGGEGGLPELLLGAAEVPGPVLLDAGFLPLPRIVLLREGRNREQHQDQDRAAACDPHEEASVHAFGHVDDIGAFLPGVHRCGVASSPPGRRRRVSGLSRPVGAAPSRARRDVRAGIPARTEYRARRGSRALLPARRLRR